MSSAEHFLRHLEEMDLVPAKVLQTARLRIQGASPPPDAQDIAAWLVQGEYITESQAQRLLSMLVETSDTTPAVPPVLRVKPPQPGEAGKQLIGRLPTLPPKPRRNQPGAAKGSSGDLELAPLGDEAPSAAKKPAQAGGAASGDPGAAGPAPVGAAKPAAIGDELESLESTMKGPLDSLIESEAIPLDDPLAGPGVAPRKFNLLRFLRDLLRPWVFFRRWRRCPRVKSDVVKIKATDPRQVKIVLVSWGVAVALFLGGLTLFWALSPPNAADILHQAEAAADKEDYAAAIQQYDSFLKHYSRTDQGDEVRMLRILAELRIAIRQAGQPSSGSAAGDWEPAFKLAQEKVQALPKIPEPRLTPELRAAQTQIGVALAQIGQGLAEQTRKKPDKDSVARLESLEELISSAVPKKEDRPTEMIDNIDRARRQCAEEVAARREIQQSVREIRAAVDDNDPVSAYAAYRNVVQAYPDLVDQPDLTAAMKLVSDQQRQAIKTETQSLAVTHEERPSDLLAAMPLAVQPLPGTAETAKGKLRFVVEQGTAYGLDAATGKLLWRRFVGLDPKLPAVAALPIADASGGDVVLSDPIHQEVLRVKGRTGEMLWRLNVGLPFALAPAQEGKSLLLLTQEPKEQHLIYVDLAGGEAQRILKLPQAVRVPPVVDAAHGLTYLVAEQANIYVFAEGRCRQVLHLAHEAGTVAAAPAVAGDFLLVPVNTARNEVTVRVLSIAAAKEDGPLESVQRIRLKGYVDAPPVALGSGAVVVTAQGGMVALERDAAGGKLPFRIAARIDTALEEKTGNFAVSDGSSFWVAGAELTRYAIEQGRIAPKAASDQGARFVATPAIDGAMFTVAHKASFPGAIVSAIDGATCEPVWRTWVAAPLAAEPLAGPASGKLTAVTVSGGMFRMPPAELRPHAAPADPVLSVEAARLTGPLRSLLALPAERFAMSSGKGSRQIVVYDPQEQDRRFRWLVSPSELAAPPAAFAGGLFAPCLNGQVCLLDPSAREDMLATPYAAGPKDNAVWQWRTPQTVEQQAGRVVRRRSADDYRSPGRRAGRRRSAKGKSSWHRRRWSRRLPCWAKRSMWSMRTTACSATVCPTSRSAR